MNIKFKRFLLHHKFYRLKKKSNNKKKKINIITIEITIEEGFKKNNIRIIIIKIEKKIQTILKNNTNKMMNSQIKIVK